MSRIYEALKKAQEQKKQGNVVVGDLSPMEVQPEEARRPVEAAELSPPEILIPEPGEQGESQEPIASEPSPHGAFDASLVALTDPNSVPAEQFKKIRTILSQLRVAKKCRTIMVTSSVPQEGKTMTSCNLGVTVTQGLDDHAVLIDCDLRRPMVHQQFGFNGRPGLADYLTGRNELSQIIHEVPGLRLKIIPAGRSRENSAELLSSDRMADFLEEIKVKYKDHYILLDTTPILLTSEAAVLARLVEGIILVILAGKTSSDAVKRAIKEIDQAKIIGAVLNNVESSGGYYSKYHYGYYHYPSTPSRRRKKTK